MHWKHSLLEYNFSPSVQRGIGGGECRIYVSANSFRFNAVCIHQDKERAITMSLNLKRLKPGRDPESMCFFSLIKIRFKFFR